MTEKDDIETWSLEMYMKKRIKEAEEKAALAERERIINLLSDDMFHCEACYKELRRKIGEK